MHHHETYMYNNFQQNRVHGSVITVYTNLFAKIANCNLNFKKSGISDMHYPLTDIQAHFEINRPVRYQVTAKINYFHRRQADRRTDGQTDKRRVRQ